VSTASTQPMRDGRQADTLRRRQRVTAALDRAAADGTEISASGIARAAAVDRTFIYRHRDLLEKIHALQAEPPPGDGTGPAVTRASLQADLLAAHERAIRLSTRIQHLEKRLSEALGDQAWRESGLGAPADIDALTQKITHLEQQVLGLKLQVEERDEDLAAARATNRELMTQLNYPALSRRPLIAPAASIGPRARAPWLIHPRQVGIPPVPGAASAPGFPGAVTGSVAEAARAVGPGCCHKYRKPLHAAVSLPWVVACAHRSCHEMYMKYTSLHHRIILMYDSGVEERRSGRR